MSENQNQHAPCPFCGEIDLLVVNSLRAGRTVTHVECLNERCGATGPKCATKGAIKAIAAAWEAWDAAGKREDAK